jgi:CDP-diacylglycerol--glycerol-3-phosphate 3-phosphatidyltransferase
MMAATESTTEHLREETTTSPPRTDRRSLNVPNSITVARLMLALVLFAMISLGSSWIAATLMFLLAAATDALDGFIARRYGLVTTLGRILDPFADKIIICGAFLFLVAQPDSGVNAWMALIVFGREMFITSLRAFLEQHGCDFSAVWSGKIKMIVQCAAVALSLLSLDAWFAAWPEFLKTRDVLLWGTVAITLYSGVEYTCRAYRLLRG